MENKKNTSIITEIKKCAESSSIHALPNIARSEYISIKIIWLVCFLVSLGYCSFGIARNLTNYLSNESNTQFKKGFEGSIDFPTITFCNKNPFKTSYDFDHLINETINDFSDYQLFYEYVDSLKKAKLGLNKTKLYELSFKNNEMLLSCLYENSKCANHDFELYHTLSFGNCYKFNSGYNENGTKIEIKKASLPGRKNALRLELFLGYATNLDFIKSKGALIFIHDPLVTPLTDIQGINVPLGYEADIVINKQTIKRLGMPYSNCILDTLSPDSYDSDLYKATFVQNKKYEQNFCVQLCRQEFYVKNCQCYSISSPHLEGNNTCSTMNELKCIFEANIQFNNKSLINVCYDKCPQECETISYNLVTSYADYPSPFYADLIMKFQEKFNKSTQFSDISQLKESTLAVNIYFEDLSYTLIEEVPARTLEQFMADVGGFMGLCIGNSILSFVEIIELILQIFYTRNYEIFKKKKIIQDESNME
jgi:hypothetical protein